MSAPLFAHRAAGSVLAMGAGAGFGYLLVNPLVFFPMELVGSALMPVLKATKSHIKSAEVAYLVQMSTLVFVRNFPNTLLVGIATILALRVLGRMRLILYSALIWPSVLYLICWLQVLILRLGAQRAGLPTDMGHLPVSPTFGYTAVFILITFSFYFTGVLLVRNWLEKRKSNALPSSDHAASIN